MSPSENAQFDAVKLGGSLRQMRASKELKYATTARQMKSAIDAMQYSEARLKILLGVVEAVIHERAKEREKLELVQQYKAKFYNLFKEFGIPLREVYALLVKSRLRGDSSVL